MASTLSNQAKEFLRGDHLGTLGTINGDGSPHLVTIWYYLADDGTVAMSTQTHSKKLANLRRDPRIALCVGDGVRSVSLYGRVTISEDPAHIRHALEHLVERYINPEGIRAQVVGTLAQQSRVVLQFRPDKVTEFSTQM